MEITTVSLHNHNLLHFTSLDTLKIILDTEKIKLSPCNEIKNYEVESEFLMNTITQLSQNNLELYKKLAQMYEENSIDSLTQKMIEERNKTYMVCFTEFDKPLNDEKHSFLWENYADSNNGVAIEFKRDEICAKYNRGISSVNNNRVSGVELIKMVYRVDEFEGLLDSLHERITCSLYLDRLKPNKCSQEKEIRLALYLNCPNDLQRLCNEMNNISDIRRFSSSKDGNYIFYNLGNENQRLSAIEAIYCRSEETRRAIESFDTHQIALNVI